MNISHVTHTPETSITPYLYSLKDRFVFYPSNDETPR